MRFSKRVALLLAAGALLLPASSRASGEEAELTVEQQAALLQRVTVTVRVTLSEDEAGALEPAEGAREGADAGTANAGRVTVCSGILLGDGLVVSAVYAGSDSRIRITLPGGRQAAAELRVLDGYSGLVLLEIERRDLEGIPLAEEPPPVGRQVLMAAAWGLQEPVVSQGIVSGVDRTLSGVSFPPLIQCDMRTAETASGAGLVDRRGRLLGIVVLADQPTRQRGWTYAVPATHVDRLRRAYETQAQDARRGGGGAAASVLILKRRRPVVGMVLGGEPDQVVVRRVEPDSPADRAGIQVGDRILAAEGVQIRSVYQAVRPVLFKQPGDLMRYVVQRDDDVRDIAVKLGGGVELPSATLENLGQYVRPKIDVEGLARGRFRASSGRGEVREVFAGAADEGPLDNVPRRGGDNEKLRMLERALDAYRNVIEYQQRELGRGAQERKQLEEQLRELKSRLKAAETDDGAP